MHASAKVISASYNLSLAAQNLSTKTQSVGLNQPKVLDSVLLNAKIWEAQQWAIESNRTQYAQPRMCAKNLSRVLEKSGLNSYSHQTVLGFLRKVRRQQSKTGKGKYVVMPTADKRGSIEIINKVFGGHIPDGTILAGCKAGGCRDSSDGKQHVGIITKTDINGIVWVHHNNWLREGDRRKWAHAMVSRRNLSNGVERQWMKTPWLKLIKVGSKVVDYKVLVPVIDDFNPNLFSMVLATLPELEGRGNFEGVLANVRLHENDRAL
jgi:hypothetical protein